MSQDQPAHCRFCDPDSPDFLEYAHWATLTAQERTSWAMKRTGQYRPDTDPSIWAEQNDGEASR